MAAPKKFWFGTPRHMQWIETPLSGAESNPEGWHAGGSTLNGRGYALHSWDNHKTYNFSWRDSSTREAAQTIHDYRNGVYGRDLIYFLSPLIYETNVLPGRLAHPARVIGGGKPHIQGLTPREVPHNSWNPPGLNKWPTSGVSYDMPQGTYGFNEANPVFVPIPEGYTLFLGAVYQYTGTGGVFYSPVTESGSVGNPVRLSQVPANAYDIHPDKVTAPGGTTLRGVYIWFGKTSTSPANVTVFALSGRLLDNRTAEIADLVNEAINGSFETPNSAVSPTPMYTNLIPDPYMESQAVTDVFVSENRVPISNLNNAVVAPSFTKTVTEESGVQWLNLVGNSTTASGAHTHSFVLQNATGAGVIPVSANSPLYVSIRVKSSGLYDSNSVSLTMYYYNASSTLIDSVTLGSVPPNTGDTRIEAVATPPTGAVRAALLVSRGNPTGAPVGSVVSVSQPIVSDKKTEWFKGTGTVGGIPVAWEGAVENSTRYLMARRSRDLPASGGITPYTVTEDSRRFVEIRRDYVSPAGEINPTTSTHVWSNAPLVVGRTYTFVAEMRRTTPEIPDVRIRPGSGSTTPAMSIRDQIGTDWSTVRYTGVANNTYISVVTVNDGLTEPGIFQIRKAAIIEGQYDGPPFGGDDPASGDFVFQWDGTEHNSTSSQRYYRPQGWTSSTSGGADLNHVIWTSSWAEDGTHSVMSVPRLGSASSSVISGSTYIPDSVVNAGFTVMVTLRMNQAQTGSIHPDFARRVRVEIRGQYFYSEAAPNEPGVHHIRLYVPPQTGSGGNRRIWLFNGSSETTVWWDNLTIVRGEYNGPQFQNDDPPKTKRQILLRGPWIGGQGHAGCRFDGEPTYVEYTGVNGGQVGYAATFREVG